MSATNSGEAAKAYIESAKNTSSHSELQFAMSEKLLELGDVNRAMEFAVLAGQTNNAEKTLAAAHQLTETSAELSRSATTFEDSGKLHLRAASSTEESMQTLNRQTSLLEETFESMRQSTVRLENSTEDFKGIANKIDSAAETINQASYRMNQ